MNAYSKLTQKEIAALVEQFLKARERLIDIITNPLTGAGTKTYYNTVLQNLEKELQQLLEVSTEFINTALPAEYAESLKETVDYFKKNGLTMTLPKVWGVIHTDALNAIQRDMQFSIASGLAAIGRQVQRHLLQSIAAGYDIDEYLRQLGLEQTLQKFATNATVGDVAASMTKALAENQLLTVDYGEGVALRHVPMDVYAAMVARSTSREAGNTARLNQLTSWGYDLVQMSEHYPTCEICAPLQGRVYSISGNDKRFPRLFDYISEEYINVHPNCRHVLLPWVERLKSEQELKDAIERSNQPFIDPRDADERKLYKEQQDKNRRLRNEMYAYDRYKEVLQADAPTTLAEYRRIVRAGGEPARLLALDYRRRKALLDNTALALPNAAKAVVESAKFTHYFFNPASPRGYPKGKLWKSKLGYNISNWELMREEIDKVALLYTAKYTRTTKYGDYYNQLVILRGLKNSPLDVTIAWELRDGKLRFVTAEPTVGSKKAKKRKK